MGSWKCRCCLITFHCTVCARSSLVIFHPDTVACNLHLKTTIRRHQQEHTECNMYRMEHNIIIIRISNIIDKQTVICTEEPTFFYCVYYYASELLNITIHLDMDLIKNKCIYTKERVDIFTCMWTLVIYTCHILTYDWPHWDTLRRSCGPHQIWWTASFCMNLRR